MDIISSLSPQNMLLLAVAIIVMVTVFFKVARKLFRIIAFILLGLVVYTLWSGKDLKETVGDTIEATLLRRPIAKMVSTCEGEKGNKAKCECIYLPLYQQLRSTYSDNEIRNLESDRDAKRKAIAEAYRNKKSIVSDCLKRRGTEGGGKALKAAVNMLNNLDARNR